MTENCPIHLYAEILLQHCIWQINFGEWDEMRSIRVWMRSSQVLIERLKANSVVATVLSSILASSDTVESEGRQMKQC
jgi:hypothetical protein